MLRTYGVVGTCLLALGAALPALGSEKAATESVALTWHRNYGDAWQEAKRQEKMLLIFFYDSQASQTRRDVVEMMKTDGELRRKLNNFVLCQQRTDAKITVDGERMTLLKHAAFGEMHGREGLAIVDLAHKDKEYYGHVVSAFPFMTGKYYRFRKEYLPVIAELPPGTITQRTMIWAVRVHPEKPASTSGQNNPVLLDAAKQHSQHQAQIGVQGHHRWETRFHRLRALLGGNRAPVEVVAESWPGQNMIDSCIDCVDSWRHSSGHWNAVRTRHAVYGYDIRRGGNGIWYGTGIFAN